MGEYDRNQEVLNSLIKDGYFKDDIAKALKRDCTVQIWNFDEWVDVNHWNTGFMFLAGPDRAYRNIN